MRPIVFVTLALCLLAPIAQAKPIAFQNGYTLMAEYGAGTMTEAQGFYAPRYWYSVGAGALQLEAEDGSFSRDLTYLRANLLLKRWNLADAQANVFASAGGGVARSSDDDGGKPAANAALQADYETLRLYGSLKADLQASSAFSHRIDTLQLGFAPYPHRYGGTATWLLLQLRHYTGGLYDGLEPAALLRLFRGPVWIEAGVTGDGKLQAMAMFNF